MAEHEHPFYGFEILKDRQHAHIESVLAKYRHRNADEALKKEIYEELQALKSDGKITIPFKIVLRKDQRSSLKNYVEVILDTKL